MLGIQDLGIQNLGIQDIALFVAAGLLLNMTPGPDTAYIVGRSVQLGWRGGAAAALGIGAGCLVHIIAAAVGLSAVLAASSTAFVVVKYTGAAYLCYAGLRMLFVRDEVNVIGPPAEIATTRAVFWQGALTNALNPKVALFFLAFLPQFVSPARGSVIAQVFLLGLIFDFNGTLVNLVVASVAGHATRWLRRSSRGSRALQRLTGAVFLGLGARLALAAHR
jgi:threonine/homoserine/homoserine lactone efflux protein